MDEKNVEKLIEKMKEASYIPRDWVGVSDRRVVDLSTVLKFINILRNERY